MKLKPFLPILIVNEVLLSSTVFSVTKPVNQRAGNNRKTMNTAPLIKIR
jgi:hypothetical protein